MSLQPEENVRLAGLSQPSAASFISGNSSAFVDEKPASQEPQHASADAEMSATSGQFVTKPERHHADGNGNEGRLDLTIATEPSTTIHEIKRELVLRAVKEELGITQEGWLRLQHEIVEFLNEKGGEKGTDEDAALAFLNDTGAKDRFFGFLSGRKAAGMLVNRDVLAWGVDDDRIIREIATIVAAWRLGVSSSHGSEARALTKRSAEDFDSTDQIGTKRIFNPKVMAMLPAGIVEGYKDPTAQYKENDSLFLNDDLDTQNEHHNESGRVPREVKQHETRQVSTHVLTALAPKNDHTQRAMPLPNRLTTSSLDVWFRATEHSLPPAPAAPKPWLKVYLYVGEEKRARGTKLLMVELIPSLASFKSQITNAFYWQLEKSRPNCQMDPVRHCIVRYGIGGRDSSARIEAQDDRAWKAALDKLQSEGEAGGVILTGHVDVHL